MRDLTVFAVPRAFAGDVARRQLNAVRSWRAQGFEVLLLGDDDGVAEAAAAEGARHLPGIARTEHGTPLVSDAFARAAEIARTPLILYANADLVFLPGVRDAVARVPFATFLGVGHRIDLEVEEELVFDTGWDARLREEARARGTHDSQFAIDWFLLPRSLDLAMPAFAIGRPGWDNWVIHRARSLGVPVVDFTPVVTVIHQRHGYDHVPGSTIRWEEGPEAEANRALAAGTEPLGILDATHVAGRRGVYRALAPRYLRRRLARVRQQPTVAGRALDRLARLRRRA